MLLYIHSCCCTIHCCIMHIFLYEHGAVLGVLRRRGWQWRLISTHSKISILQKRSPKQHAWWKFYHLQSSANSCSLLFALVWKYMKWNTTWFKSSTQKVSCIICIGPTGDSRYMKGILLVKIPKTLHGIYLFQNKKVKNKNCFERFRRGSSDTYGNEKLAIKSEFYLPVPRKANCKFGIYGKCIEGKINQQLKIGWIAFSIRHK